MSIPATVFKGQATGNDFVLYADPDGQYDPSEEEVVRLCDRHFGVGADGLIRLTRPEHVADLSAETVDRLRADGAEWFMDYRNADGSLAEMCGNGTRATARFAADVAGVVDFDDFGDDSRGSGETGASDGGKNNDAHDDVQFRLGTRAGVKVLTSLGEVDGLGRHVFRVDMGDWSMGAAGDGKTDEYVVTMGAAGPAGGTGAPTGNTADGEALGTFVDMGNPHVVAVIEDAYSSLPVLGDLNLTVAPVVVPATKEPTISDDPARAEALAATRAAALEHGQNVEFVRVDEISADEDLGEATMRVFERGCGETLSCGTGLCATAIVLRAKTGVNHWLITVRGGTLRLDVTDDDILLTGDAEIVYEATLR
ncbi:diaminopimelate epimerase [Bifidobacterium choloepi]|uniref:Diaminopimelate epimerase n=1 Tax=Bifidobacterium choloepi TaxID=2614131 RepID=A0A6I5N9Z9_9BIFI|nr:diaminopimelate epimerase [Bifidobacterium choloepi]NEG70621.1 diaminopimelate epimerase [Bifidobacterium choloepi]